jgi:hypothetical protein
VAIVQTAATPTQPNATATRGADQGVEAQQQDDRQQDHAMALG